MNVICLLLCALSVDVYTDFFDRGNAAYAAGAMAEAATAYEQLAASGVVNPEVYFNLGNAWYHQGDWGRAVLNYERCLGLDPGFAPAERNLATAILATAHHFDRPAGFALDTWRASWVPGLPIPILAGGLLVLWWGLWGILAFRQGRGEYRHKTNVVLWCLLALCAASMLLRPPQIRSAVVTTPESAMRYGPDERDARRATLAAGDRVLIDRIDGDWVRVETADGVRGWTPKASITWVGPPFAQPSTERESVPQ